MEFLNQNFNAIIIILFILLLFSFLIYLIVKLWAINKRNKYLKGFITVENDEIKEDRKTLKRIDKDLKETLGIWFSIDLKFIKFKKVNDSPDKILAWYCFIEMMTRVISNTFDKKGKCKEVLNSTYFLFKSIKKYTLENVNANNSAKISLIYMNKILRPFLIEWDSKINSYIVEIGEDKNAPSFQTLNEIEKKFRRDFEKSYKVLIEQTKKEHILEKYCHFVGIKIKLNKYTNKI
ncbi:hypothetical protein [Spiroplasma endosymbiont of Cantharis rufa]|uniref:hypothetical protein n=1 Tax=Spiroplasma endosymbiont of Cantharis rufa TaxID=3066279 RepID=UPI0030CBF20C